MAEYPRLTDSTWTFRNGDTVGDPKYFGFVNKQGSQTGLDRWKILKLTITGGLVAEYAHGESDYSTAWSSRASHSYV